MKFKTDFLKNYLKHAPAPLALERSIECELLSQLEFKAPVLDIGCGEGLFAHILFNEKIDVGIDPDKKELEQCNKYEGYKELIQCFGNNIPKESGSFNTVFSNSVLEHIPEIDEVLKEAHRLLTDSGKMYITIPTNLFDNYSLIFQTLSFFKLRTLAEKYRIFFNKFWRHYHYYDVKNWKAKFEKNGFVVLNHREYNSKSMCLLNDFLVPFSLPCLISKKATNEWILFPALRNIFVQFLYPFFAPVYTANLKKDNNCGLVFFEISKTKLN